MRQRPTSARSSTASTRMFLPQANCLPRALPPGVRLDFLAQEFAREANTLCAKSNHRSLTAIGLELKAVVDQLREQIQNLE